MIKITFAATSLSLLRFSSLILPRHMTLPGYVPVPSVGILRQIEAISASSLPGLTVVYTHTIPRDRVMGRGRMASNSGRVQVIEVHIKCKRNQKIANGGGILGGGVGQMVEYWPDSGELNFPLQARKKQGFNPGNI